MDQIDRGTGEVMAAIERNRMPPEIAAAIVAVKKQIRQLGADERNEHARYNYVSVDKFYSIIGPLMAEAGLALLINEAESEVRASEGEKRTPWLFVRYELTFLHESGAMSLLPMSRSLAMPINGPQTYGAAQSYIEKQFLRQVFKVPTGEKDADEVAQDQEAPTGRSGGRAAQGGNSGARSYPQRSQAAPAPSDAAQEVERKWKQIAADIDGMEDPEMLLRLPEWLVFEQLDKLSADLGPPAVHAERMDLLRRRAAKRREQLPGSLAPVMDYDPDPHQAYLQGHYGTKAEADAMASDIEKIAGLEGHPTPSA